MNCKISLNQLADFSAGSEAVKKRIIGQQLKPNLFKVPRYQATKASIKKSISLKGSLDPIHETIKALEEKKTTTDWQLNDKKVSLEALQRFINIKVPSLIKKIDYAVFKPKKGTLEISDVDIIVSPEVVIKGKWQGQNILGGVKIHISKTKPFDLAQSKYVAAVIYKYLKDEVADKDDIVVPELCLCLDVFNGRLVPSPDLPEKFIADIKKLCGEIKLLWTKEEKRKT